MVPPLSLSSSVKNTADCKPSGSEYKSLPLAGLLSIMATVAPEGGGSMVTVMYAPTGALSTVML